MNAITFSKRNLTLLLSGIALVGGIAMGIRHYAIHHAETSPNAIVATVNGEPIVKREFEQELLSVRSSVSSYFYSKYHAQEDSGFWTRSYQGEIPLEVARKDALEQLKTIKIEQILAKQNGIVSDIGYDHFLQDWTAENKRRQLALQQHQVIYGPQQYGEQEYNQYVMNNMLLQLKQKLQQNQQSSDSILQAHYEQIKDSMFNLGNKGTVMVVTLRARAPSDNKDVTNVKTIAGQVKQRLEQGETAGQAVADLASQAYIQASLQKIEFNDPTEREESEQYPLWRHAMSAFTKVGEVSPVIEDSPTEFAILQCVQLESLGYRPYDEVKDAVLNDLFEKQFQQQIAEQVRQANVQIHEPVYRQTGFGS